MTSRLSRLFLSSVMMVTFTYYIIEDTFARMSNQLKYKLHLITYIITSQHSLCLNFSLKKKLLNLTIETHAWQVLQQMFSRESYSINIFNVMIQNV
jgi:hypothetical protein